MGRYVAAPAEYLRGYHPEAQVYAEMSPDDYLRALGPGGTPGEGFYVSKDALEKVRRRMEAGEELDPLFIDWDPYQKKVTNHEGRHRALAARELGIKKIPVIIFFYDVRGWHDVLNQWGEPYDQTHYVRRDELSRGEILEALGRLGATEVLVPQRRPRGPYHRRTVSVRSYRRRR